MQIGPSHSGNTKVLKKDTFSLWLKTSMLLFGFGEINISTVDEDAIALAAIKARSQENEKLRGINTAILEKLQIIEKKREDLK